MWCIIYTLHKIHKTQIHIQVTFIILYLCVLLMASSRVHFYITIIQFSLRTIIAAINSNCHATHITSLQRPQVRLFYSSPHSILRTLVLFQISLSSTLQALFACLMIRMIPTAQAVPSHPYFLLCCYCYNFSWIIV